MTWIGWTALGVGMLVIAVVAMIFIGDARWASATKTQLAKLDAANKPAPLGQHKRYEAREIEDLPAPVRRYFRAVLKDGQPLIAAATFELAGTFNRDFPLGFEMITRLFLRVFSVD